MAQARALLVRHAAAVIRHSAPAFLADVDRSVAAAGFRSRQASQIADLADVPLHSWAYTVVAPVTDPETIGAAARRYGAKTLIVRVSLAYALDHVDTEATRHDLWLSFVERDGRAYLAGDDDVLDSGGVSWRGPWDFGPLLAARGSASLVLGPPQDAARLGELAATVDAAVPVVTGVWGTGWSQRVAAIVPSGREEFSALVGSGSAVSDISAVAVTDGEDPATGKPYGQRVVMNPDAFGTLGATGLRIVVQHEITHLATAASTGARTPRWIVEGFADYVANLGSGQPTRAAAAELAAEVRRGTVASTLPSDAEFAPSNPRLPQVYEESWLACRLIAARAGQAGLVRFYRLAGTAAGGPDSAVATAMQATVHESVALFTAQWRAYLSSQLG